MKKIWQKSIVFAVMLFVAFGCSAFRKVQEQVDKSKPPQVFTSTDGSCQLSVPDSWKKETGLNVQATLQASNRLTEEYVVVIRESKQDFGKMANLSFVTNVIQEQLKKNLTNGSTTQATPATIGGFPAQQFEADGEVSNIKVKYLYGVVETPTNFYQIITWTMTSRFNENRPHLMEVINSFKELNASSPTTPTSAPANKSR